MFVSESMYELGSKRSAIRELFEYGKKRAAIVGAENVYDFSLGNPTVPAPDCVNETIRELTQSLDSISLHGYTSAQGDLETRQAIADYLNNTYGAGNLLSTCRTRHTGRVKLPLSHAVRPLSSISACGCQNSL